jgi:hypothetical protein
VPQTGAPAAVRTATCRHQRRRSGTPGALPSLIWLGLFFRATREIPSGRGASGRIESGLLSRSDHGEGDGGEGLIRRRGFWLQMTRICGDNDQWSTGVDTDERDFVTCAVKTIQLVRLRPSNSLTIHISIFKLHSINNTVQKKN